MTEPNYCICETSDLEFDHYTEITWCRKCGKQSRPIKEPTKLSETEKQLWKEHGNSAIPPCMHCFEAGQKTGINCKFNMKKPALDCPCYKAGQKATIKWFGKGKNYDAIYEKARQDTIGEIENSLEPFEMTSKKRSWIKWIAVYQINKTGIGLFDTKAEAKRQFSDPTFYQIKKVRVTEI